MFEKFKKNKTTIKELYVNLSSLPNTKGVYIIECPKDFKVEFLNDTKAPKKHKDKNLLYDKDALNKKYENGDKEILYIGKTTCQKGLKNRLGAYLQYGYGKEVAHRGGRAIWQIKNCYDLTVYYCECENANECEKSLLKEYKEKYGVFPVANWRV